MRLAELNLGYTDIRAPVAGRIAESDAFVGSLATKNSPKPLTLLSPLDPIQVKVKIGERDYLNYIRTLSPNEEERKKQVDHVVSAFSSSWVMAAPIPTLGASGQGIGPWIRRPAPWKSPSIFPIPRRRCCRASLAACKIQTGEKSGVFLVPQRAITELQGVRTVYLVGTEGAVETRTVTAGERLGNLWAIEKGLAAGDRVIVEGIQRVQPGMKVNVKTEPEPQPQPTTRSSAR